MKFAHLLFICFFFLMTALPGLQSQLRFAPRVSLSGAVQQATLVPLRWESFRDGSFQRAFEAWFAQRLGFRGQLVRAENELNVRAFGHFQSNANAGLLLGKNQVLFERPYLEAMQGKNAVPVSTLQEKVRLLEVLATYLQQDGKALVLIISPNKAVLYRNDIPAKYQYASPSATTNYEIFRDLLATTTIPVIDMQARLSRADDPFEPTAAHWNDPVACEVMKLSLDQLGVQLNRTLRQLDCRSLKTRTVPLDADRDLLKLANLWNEKRFYTEARYVDSALLTPTPPAQLQALYIGSSYVWSLLKFVSRHRLFQETTFLYYFASRHSYPGPKGRAIDRAKIRWKESIFSRDAILIEINAAFVHDVGFGFLEEAEAAIRRERSG